MYPALLVRDATEAGVPVIRDIHNHALEHTTAIRNERLVDVEKRLVMARKAKGFPMIVAELEGEVVATLPTATGTLSTATATPSRTRLCGRGLLRRRRGKRCCASSSCAHQREDHDVIEAGNLASIRLKAVETESLLSSFPEMIESGIILQATRKVASGGTSSRQPQSAPISRSFCSTAMSGSPVSGSW